MTPLVRGFSRVFAAIGVIILLLVVLVAGAVWLTIPAAYQSASIPGLAGPVDITYDADWVPAHSCGLADRCRRRHRISPRARPAVPDGADAPSRLRPVVRNCRAGGAADRPDDAHAGSAPACGRRLRHTANRNPIHARGLRTRRERLDRPQGPLRRAGVRRPRRPRTLAGDRQPAMGKDDGAVAVDELAPGARPPGPGRTRAPRRCSTSFGQRSRQCLPPMP